MSNPEDTEKAFLAWLTSLNISEMPLTSIIQLKDGLLLSKLLNLL